MARLHAPSAIQPCRRRLAPLLHVQPRLAPKGVQPESRMGLFESGRAKGVERAALDYSGGVYT